VDIEMTKAKRDEKTQAQLFIDKARELGADDDARAAEIMKRLASQPKAERKPLKKKKAAK
jgi:predicted nucleic acid-binding protein